MNTRPHLLVRQILGVYQLLVGGYGALFFAVQIIRAGGASLAGLIFVAIYALVAWAGWRLLKARPDGAALTVLAQTLQAIRITSSSFAYVFVAGAAYWVSLGSGGLGMSGLTFWPYFRWMTASGFGPRAAAEPFSIGLNLVAAAIVAYFLYGRSAGKKKRR